jgi:putative peptide zinc metalloprotease protein
VRGATEGFVVKLVAAPGSKVSRGQPLIETIDPLLGPRLHTLEARRDELEARYYADRADNLVKGQMTLEGLKALDTELARARERAADLVMKSPSDGHFAVAAPADLPGRYVRQGELVGYVIPEGNARVRVVVPQNAADLVRASTDHVTVKLAERLAETFEARIVREVPRAIDRIPSMALTPTGGGEIALDPASTGPASAGAAPKTLQTHFEFELEVLAARPLGAGGRVYVRFDHAGETLAAQAWRLTRQLFLKRFST